MGDPRGQEGQMSWYIGVGLIGILIVVLQWIIESRIKREAKTKTVRMYQPPRYKIKTVGIGGG